VCGVVWCGVGFTWKNHRKARLWFWFWFWFFCGLVGDEESVMLYLVGKNLGLLISGYNYTYNWGVYVRALAMCVGGCWMQVLFVAYRFLLAAEIEA
jgi:hypothetical protein